MKKTNTVIIATIIATFVFSMFAFQPTATEASNNVAPSATPSPRKIRAVPTSTREIKRKKTRPFAQDAGMETGIRRKQPRRKRNN